MYIYFVVGVKKKIIINIHIYCYLGLRSWLSLSLFVFNVVLLRACIKYKHNDFVNVPSLAIGYKYILYMYIIQFMQHFKRLFRFWLAFTITYKYSTSGLIVRHRSHQEFSILFPPFPPHHNDHSVAVFLSRFFFHLSFPKLPNRFSFFFTLCFLFIYSFSWLLLHRQSIWLVVTSFVP